MNDGKIHIPGRKLKKREDNNIVVKITPEAYNALEEIYEESSLSMRQLVSTIIIQSVENIVFDKEEE